MIYERNDRSLTERTLEVLRVLWPTGIPTSEYNHALRVIRLIGSLPDETATEFGLAPAPDGYGKD